MKYKFIKDTYKLIREEDDGTCLLMSKKTGTQLILNPTGKLVLDTLPKYYMLQDIVKEILEKYDTMDERIVEKDVYELLLLFELYGIVEIVENRKEDKDDKISFTGDIDYKSVSEFINQCIENNSFKYYRDSKKDYYSPIGLRMRVMQNKEFAVYVKKKGIPIGYLSFSAEGFDTSCSIMITSLFISGKMDLEKQGMVFNDMVNYIVRKSIGIKPFKKVRISVINDMEKDAFVNTLKSFGLKEECRLKDETLNGDMVFYTKFL